MSMLPTKICGLSEPGGLQAAMHYGARYVGFVFYPASSRAVSIGMASLLSRQIGTGVLAVGLFVNPTDEEVMRTVEQVPLDMIQLHGSESPGRVACIKKHTGMQVMKAIPVADENDLSQISGYETAADWLLFDTKVYNESGGTGHTFDWELLKGRNFKKPWMLAGGITIDNVEEALRIIQPDAIDISSGVEKVRGQKDPDKIRDFLQKVQQF